MSKVLMSVACALLAAAATAQTPKELLEMTRGEFDGLAATATVRFDGRDWSKSELVKELDRRAKGPGAIPRGKEVTIGAARARGASATQATQSRGSSRLRPETLQALKTAKPTDGPQILEAPQSLSPCAGQGYPPSQIMGCNLIYSPGTKLTLLGQFPGGGIDLELVSPQAFPNLDIPGLEPSPPGSILHFRVPCTISGVKDHTAKLQAIVLGESSNQVPVQFKASRVYSSASPSWVSQSIAATADSNVKLTPGHGDAPAWCKDSFGAKHSDQNMAYGVDTLKVVVPGSCTLVGADLRWDTVNGQEVPGTWVIEKRRSLSGNTLEIELMWGPIGSGLVYGIEPRVTAIAGFPCT